MSRATDLDRARKKLNRKKSLRRLLTLVVVAAIAAAIYLFRIEISTQGLGAMASDAIASVFNNTGYPVELDAPPVQLTSVGRRAVAVSDGLLSVYNAAGNQVFAQRLNGQNPIVVPAGKRLLVYAQGNNSLSLYSGETVLFKTEFDQPIYTAALSPSGVCAVSTGAVGYQSQVTVLDTRYEKLFEWASAESIVLTLGLDATGTACAVGSVRSEGGLLSSTLRLFELSGGVERWSLLLPDELLLYISINQSGTVTAVSDSAVQVLSEGGKVLHRYDFGGEPLNAFFVHPDGAVDLALGDYASVHNTHLVRLDDSGKASANASVVIPVQQLLSCGEDLLAFSGDSALLFSPEFKLLRRIETPDASHATVIKDHLYYTTAGELRRVFVR